MNLFVQELKQGARGLALWCLGMMLLVGACVGKTSGMTGANGQAMEMMVALLPKSLQRLFGLGTVDFSDPAGLFAIVAMYISLIASFHAMGLGVAALAKEERDRTFEFLYVRGKTRGAILTAKLLAGLLQMAALSAFTFFVSVALVRAAEGADIAARFLPMMLGIGAVQAVFCSLGLLASMMTRRMRAASSAASGALMALFLLSLLGEMAAPDSALLQLSPFAQFDGKRILIQGLSAQSVAAWLALSGAMVALSYALHARRDLKT